MNWRGLPLPLAATLASGLPPESRVMRRMSGESCETNTLLLAHIADAAALLLWRHCKKGTPQPRSLAAILTGQGEAEPETEIRVFRDGKAFDKALAEFIEPVGGDLNGK